MSTVCEALEGVRTKWFEIGIGLGIPQTKLLEFKEESDPLSAMVGYWLMGSATEFGGKPMSWNAIVEVLRSHDVGEPGLAEQISRELCQLDAQTEIGKKQLLHSYTPL